MVQSDSILYILLISKTFLKKPHQIAKKKIVGKVDFIGFIILIANDNFMLERPSVERVANCPVGMDEYRNSLTDSNHLAYKLLFAVTMSTLINRVAFDLPSLNFKQVENIMRLFKMY